MGRAVGIDLGTTNSVIAIVDHTDNRVLYNRQNELMTPSIVLSNKGDILVGSPAYNLWTTKDGVKNTVFSVKRLIGRAIDDPEVARVKEMFSYEVAEPVDGTRDSIRVIMDRKAFSPIEISAHILRKLKDDAEHVLGEPVTHAVITVPAYFSDKQRQATWEAGTKAGLTVMKLLDEPVAAAVAYGIETRQQSVVTVLIYDLGGGTFDISVMNVTAGSHSELNKEGDMWLGGDNFDRKIMDYVAEKVIATYKMDPRLDPKVRAKLKKEAEKAKVNLSASNSYTFIVEGGARDSDGDPVDIIVELDRGTFERLIQPLVNRSIELTKKAIENAHLTEEDIDVVLMVGNSSSVPLIQRELEKLFGKAKIRHQIHPKYCVAQGAALIAAAGFVTCPKCGHQNKFELEQCEQCDTPLGPYRIQCPSCGSQNAEDARECVKCGFSPLRRGGASTSIAPFSYGVQTTGDEYSIFIKKGDRFETPREQRVVQTFYTLYPNMRKVNIPVYGGENRERASKNAKQGIASAILPPDLSIKTPVHVTLWLNTDGFFELSATLNDGTDLHPRILRGEIDQQIEERLERIESIAVEQMDHQRREEGEVYGNLRERVYSALSAGDLSSAERELGVLEDAVSSMRSAHDSCNEADIVNRAQGLIGFSKNLIKRYQWAFSSDVGILRGMISGLEDSLKLSDPEAIESKFHILDQETDRLLGWGPDGDPTLIGLLYGLHNAIGNHIRPHDPVKAIKLSDTLDTIEEGLKNGDPAAMSRLTVFSKLLSSELESAADDSDARVCPNCGTKNPIRAPRCTLCDEDLTVLATEKAFGKVKMS